MRKPAFLLVLATLSVSAVAEPPPDWRIESGPVRIEPGEHPGVSGTFLVRAPEGKAPDTTARSGGACLLADLVPFGVGLPTCMTTSECNTPEAIDKANHPEFEGYFGYCTGRDGSDEPKRCWTRPGSPETHCRRTIDGFELTAREHRVGPVDADPLGKGPPYPEWVVYACISDAGHPRACGGPLDANRQISVTVQQ